MRCEEFEKELVAFSDGELDEAARERVAAHLAECAECKALAADLSVLSTALSAGQEISPSVGFESRLREKLEGFKSGKSRAPVGQRLLPFPALAAAAVVVGILLGGRIFRTPASNESGLARASSRITLELSGFGNRPPNSLSFHLERFMGGVR